MKIERLTVRKDSYGSIREIRKTVCTAIDEHHYLLQCYSQYPRESDEWLDAGSTTNFDGQNKVNGVLMTCTIDTVDKKFDLLIEYEGYRRVD